MLSDKPLLYVSSAFLSALDIIIEWTSVFNKHTHSLTHPKAKAKHVQTVLWKAVASLKKRGGGGAELLVSVCSDSQHVFWMWKLLKSLQQ